MSTYNRTFEGIRFESRWTGARAVGAYKGAAAIIKRVTVSGAHSLKGQQGQGQVQVPSAHPSPFTSFRNNIIDNLSKTNNRNIVNIFYEALLIIIINLSPESRRFLQRVKSNRSVYN